MFGAPRVVRDPARAHSVPAYAMVTPGDGFSQLSRAQPGSLYTVRVWARADEPRQSALLRILWLDSGHQLVDTAITRLSIDSEWRPFEASFTALPDQTAFGQLSLPRPGANLGSTT
jgi:hypothetical protein